MSRKRPDRVAQSGFTIVELLIATLVFSLILVVMTVGVMSFTRAYYKGVTASSTQNAARSVTDDISQAIQFSGLRLKLQAAATDNNGSRMFCVGNTQYSYLPGWQLQDGVDNDVSGSRNRYVFVRYNPTGGCVDNAGLRAQNLRDPASVRGTELLSPNMRLADVQLTAVAGDPNLYKLSVRVVYGDADLLTNPTGPDATCRNGLAGNQFCAVSQLSTTVQKRVN